MRRIQEIAKDYSRVREELNKVIKKIDEKIESVNDKVIKNMLEDLKYMINDIGERLFLMNRYMDDFLKEKDPKIWDKIWGLW